MGFFRKFPSKESSLKSCWKKFGIYSNGCVQTFSLKVTSIFCYNVAFKVQLMKFFTWWKNCISCSRYLDFTVFHEYIKFKICDVIMSISAYQKTRFYCFSWILFSIKMKLGEISVKFTTNISNLFIISMWKLRPSSRPFLSFQPVAITQQAIMTSFSC